MSDTSTIANRYKAELPTILIGLVILGAMYMFIGLKLPLVGGILACILISPAFPPRYSWIASLVGYGGLAALCYFYYHQPQIAMLLCVAAVVFAASSFFSKGRL